MMKSRVLYKDTLLYKESTLIWIDRTADWKYWVDRHGLSRVDTVETEKDGTFDIYQSADGQRGCAIPA